MGDAMLERLTATNPDRLDSLFLLNPVETGPGLRPSGQAVKPAQNVCRYL